MTTMSRAGNVYADLACEFARAFPLGELVTTKEFDEWGMGQQEISRLPVDVGYDAVDKASPEWQRLLTERNDLRRRINAGASSEAFKESGFATYSVDVNRHGDDYTVRPALESYEELSAKLPAAVERFAKTKRRRVINLKESIDFTKLPPAQQLMVSQLDRHIRLLMKDIGRRIDDFNEEYAEVREQIRLLGLEPSNGGLVEFVEDEELAWVDQVVKDHKKERRK